MPGLALLRAVILDFKPRLANRCKLFPDYTLLRASILDFRVKLANRCMLFPVYPLFRAAILDFRGQFGNHCMVMPVYALFCAAIRDFRGSIWESLQGYARLRPLACSDSGFQGVNLGITARLCQFTPSCVQRFLISSPDLRIDAAEKSSACSGRSGNEVRVRF